MRDRLELHQKLIDVLGSNHVYFQPPEDIRLRYPCIVYERDAIDVNPADDFKYLKNCRYEVIYISDEPDTNDFIADMLDEFQYIRYDRHFVSDNLNHETFSIFY